MKRSNRDPNVEDPVSNPTYIQFRQELKARALLEVRQRRSERRAVMGLMCGLSTLAMLFTSWQIRMRGNYGEQSIVSSRQLGMQDSVLATTRSIPGAQALPSQPSEAEGARTITDDELVRLFPPDTVFLADLNGHACLVFRDEKLQAEVMR
jgi:hypothetical protein